MKRRFSTLPLSLILFSGLMITGGCEKKDPAGPTNHAPTINAIQPSVQVTHYGEVITLYAHVSDWDGDSLSYVWMLEGGTSLSDLETDSVMWRMPEEGVSVRAGLQVSDGEHLVSETLTLSLISPVTWTRTNANAGYNIITSVVAAADEGYALLTYHSDATDRFDLSHINNSGDRSWGVTFSDDAGSSGASVIRMADGSYLSAGKVWQSETSSSAFLTHVGANGAFLWETSWQEGERDDAQNVAVASDGTIYVIGNSRDQDVGYRAVTSAFSPEGEHLWSTVMMPNEPSWSDQVGIVALPEGGCLVGCRGSGMEFNISFFVLDSDGSILESYCPADNVYQAYLVGLIENQGQYYAVSFGFPPFDSNLIIYTIIPGSGVDIRAVVELNERHFPFGTGMTNNGTLLLAGYTQNPDNFDDTDALLMNITLDGSVLWQRSHGGEYRDLFYEAIPANDGGFLCVGSTMSSSSGDADTWIVKTDHVGRVADE